MGVPVGDVFDHCDKVRARMIARTEVARSANAGQFEAQVISGVVSSRKWIGNPDERIRKDHLALHRASKKAPVPLGEPFRVAGHEAMYPGGFGVASLDINCRCTTVMGSSVLDEPKSAAKGVLDGNDDTAEEPLFTEKEVGIWKSFDGRLRSWEDETTDALRRGFQRQKSDLVEWLATP